MLPTSREAKWRFTLSGKSHTGNVHRYYKCSTAKRKNKCSLKAVKTQWIEDFVITEAMKMLADNKVLERVADLVLNVQNKGNSAIPLLRQQFSDTEKQIDNMVAAIAQGIVTPSTKKKLNDLEQQKGELEIKLLQEEISVTKKPLVRLYTWQLRH